METTKDPKIARLLAGIQTIRYLDREVPAQTIVCLLYVASHNPCYKAEMEKAINISTASGSRNTDWLSEKHRIGKDGMGLISKSVDPADPRARRVILKLTKKGEMFIENLKSIIYE